jgi:hypothetical protein
LLFSFFMLHGLRAQVTIGSSNIPPAEGALLDLKEHQADNDGSTSRKGVLFPRVALSSQNSLDPLVKDASQEEKLKHRGAVVYNITVAPKNNLREGLYLWSGSKWMLCAEDDTGVWKITGDAGIDPAKNYLGTSDNQPLVIKANGKEGLRISADGKLYIAHADILPDAKMLVRGAQGVIGTAGSIPIRTMLMQSSDKQEYESTSPVRDFFNEGGEEHALAIQWKAADRKTNSIVKEDVFSSGGTIEEFTVARDGTYELSGFILYQPNSIVDISEKTIAEVIKGIKVAGYTGVNVAIQLKRGGGAWKNIAATRQLWSANAMAGVVNAAIVPSTAEHLEKGDKLRMVFYYPAKGWGRPHGTNGKWGITNAPGNDSDTKKMFKIVAIN